MITDTACVWVNPIYLVESDHQCLAGSTARQILAHNEAWDRFCGEGARQ